MIYGRKEEKELSEELFQEPTSEYRGAPFWAWNEKLDPEKIKRHIHQFQEMGMGGFHIHCRVGLDTEYLGKKFFECVHASIDEAKKEELLCYLYDEDRWPSGSAGGLVTREKKYRTRFLVLTPFDYQESSESVYMSAAKAVRSQDRIQYGCYEVELDPEGYLVNYRYLKEEPLSPSEPSEKNHTIHLWRAHLEISGDTPWFNNQAYVNTLDPEAIREFIHKTHETYYQELKEDFGKEIHTIFTDEPQTTHKGMFLEPFADQPVITPFTDRLEERFHEEFGYSILSRLPEIFWEKRDRTNYRTRYQYHRLVMEMFSEAFGDQIGTWCEEHGIGLTGHMMNEWTLYSQSLAIGECMRPMKHFAIPGVDMLCDRREYSTMKQAQSVAHQFDREGVLSEIYGVTGWDFDLRNHKLAGDWQAALGVTLRVPHLTWLSMAGEGKRDYPASIGSQSPWYKEYPVVENHFARLNTALTRGKPVVKVGVIHPVESYWMYWGNKKQTSLVRQNLETHFQELIEWLLFDLIDFDFISESLLEEENGKVQNGKFKMGSMLYETVIVPDCHTIRRHTLECLKKFSEAGGNVIFLGDVPKYIDGEPDELPTKIASGCVRLPFDHVRLIEALNEVRDVDVDVIPVDGEDASRMKHVETGVRATNLFYQMREDGENRWLFLCHVNPAVNENIAFTEEWTIQIRGIYSPVCYDTMTGEVFPVEASWEKGWTRVKHYSSLHGSLLLKLLPGKTEFENVQKPTLVLPESIRYFHQPKNVWREEENVLLLDQCEYAFDEEPWQEREEILRIDNLFREKLGYPQRMEALAQPWVQKDEEHIGHMLKLRFRLQVEEICDDVFLALENASDVDIYVNHKRISNQVVGWYVDESIEKIALPPLGRESTENILEIHIPFGRKTNVEWMYLLGDFGVRAAGREVWLQEAPKSICFGDLAVQGMPFYSGNINYENEIETGEGELYLQVPHYRGGLMRVWLDEEDKGVLFLAPYRKSLGNVSAGKHTIRIRLYGNRTNTFGALHHADATEKWYGPNLWRTTGVKWCYEYQLKPFGILSSPVYWIASEEENHVQ